VDGNAKWRSQDENQRCGEQNRCYPEPIGKKEKKRKTKDWGDITLKKKKKVMRKKNLLKGEPFHKGCVLLGMWEGV